MCLVRLMMTKTTEDLTSVTQVGRSTIHTKQLTFSPDLHLLLSRLRPCRSPSTTLFYLFPSLSSSTSHTKTRIIFELAQPQAPNTGNPWVAISQYAQSKRLLYFLSRTSVLLGCLREADMPWITLETLAHLKGKMWVRVWRGVMVHYSDGLERVRVKGGLRGERVFPRLRCPLFDRRIQICVANEYEL